MNLDHFVDKWRRADLPERSAAQQHFIDLCALLGQATPAQADPTGDWYTFEKRVNKFGGDEKGFADVWKRDFFAWEYKGKRKDLSAAYIQLSAYHEDLGNPPLLVVCDMKRFEVHLKVTNTEKRIFTFDLDDLGANSPTLSCPIVPIEVLHAVMANPKALYPHKTAEQVTQEIAQEFGGIARNLILRGNDSSHVARFLIRILFCLFSEDVGLLKSGMFTEAVEQLKDTPQFFSQSISSLFRVMATGGAFGGTLVKHFNGGLFTDDSALELTKSELNTLLMLARRDWKGIEPSIFGTMFERSLDPAKRSQLGAHYTSRADIEAIVEPVLLPPLRRQWKAVQSQAIPIIEHKRIIQAEQKPDTTPAEKTRIRRAIATADTQLTDLLREFTEKIASVRVLDPACGSGNFLYVSLRYLLDLEHEVIQFAYRNGLTGFFPQVSPEQMRGIEINEYAHELAPVTIWIGYLQWMRENGYSSGIQEPILRRMDMVEHRDALMNIAEDGSVSESIWPEADFVVGNPPFLGGNKFRRELGDECAERLWKLYGDRLTGGADLVTYWFEKTRHLVASGRVQRAGLLSTNSIRNGANRKVLERIKDTGDIFMAWSDRPWLLDGAAVRVSMVGFDNGIEQERFLDGKPVPKINADLSMRADVTAARILPENAGIAFQGVQKGGAFDLDDDTAARMLSAPTNPNGRKNRDVVRRRLGGQDVVKRDREGWIIDFFGLTEEEASLYELPFQYVVENIKPERMLNNRASYREKWWLHIEPRQGLRRAIGPLSRCIVTPEVSKHRVFVWMPTTTVPDKKLHIFARDDDYFLGVLQSRVHEVWSLSLVSSVGETPSYASQTTFGTFPMPWVPGSEPSRKEADDPESDSTAFALEQAVGASVNRLVTLRNNWLNPDGASEAELKKRTLTDLYNARPTWLTTAHRKLDEAVHAAYGWPADLADEDILSRLLELNQDRACGRKG